jgi:hypothetical protein
MVGASSTSKTGRHDIAEILLKVALKYQKSKSMQTELYEYVSLEDIFILTKTL